MTVFVIEAMSAVVAWGDMYEKLSENSTLQQAFDITHRELAQADRTLRPVMGAKGILGQHMVGLLQKLCQACAKHVCIVLCGKVPGEAWANYTQGIVDPRRAAVQQQQPTRLEV